MAEKQKQMLLDFGEEYREKIEEKNDGTYTVKKSIIQYDDVNVAKPEINDLLNVYKYMEIILKIKQSKVTEEEKKFLMFGATRHIMFDFSKIAQYYVNASPEMQKLMEEQALVIIDYDNAVEYGYTHLSLEVDKMSEEDYISAKDINGKNQ